MLLAVVLPTGHGKSTIHGTIPRVYDAGELVVSKSHLRLIRKQARQTHAWGHHDAWWSDQIKTNLPADCVVLMVPSLRLAEVCGIHLIITILLPDDLICSALVTRPKSGIHNALANKREEEGKGRNVVYARSYDNLVSIVRLLAFAPQTSSTYGSR
jgi:hypothetical protein